MKLGRGSLYEHFVGDGTSSFISESSRVVFLELQRLSKYERLPIRKFIQEHISKFQGEKDVSRRSWLLALAEAVKEQDNDGKDEDIEKENLKAEYCNILHTACAVGNYWLVKFQIEAGVDVSALDQHSWSALMIATALGHTSCAKLLSEHMETREVKAAPQAFLPSTLVFSQPKKGLLTLSREVAFQSNIPCFNSDHPIPPHSQSFYYEVTILSRTINYWCVYVGATKLLYTNSSF